MGFVPVAFILVLCWPFAAISQAGSGGGTATAKTNGPQAVEAFEVASFRVSQDPVHHFHLSGPGASEFVAEDASLDTLLQLAFPNARVTGQPKWFSSTLYTIRAKAPGGKGLTYEELRRPLLQLLQERLNLRYHSSVEEVAGYALVAGKDGPKLDKSKGGPHQAGVAYGAQEGRVMVRNATAEEIAWVLGHASGYLPAVDETGLKGSYDFQLRYAAPEATDSTLPGLVTVIREDLGLQFVKQKVPQTTIAIDHVDEVPAEN
jgi:uncharacterized protein (TIGR03435 family)